MYENIPQELKQLNRWVCWKLEERDGKPTKVPINPKTGGRAMSNKPDTWGSYSAALECLKKYNLSGIGFMFCGDGIVGVDIDNCRNPETGALTDEARDIITTLDSYTEWSQSGNGIHIICRGKLPAGKRRKGSVEMYETGRFFIMTGNILDDGHTEIEERTTELTKVHEKYLSVDKKAKKGSKTFNEKCQPEITLDDEEIIAKASSAKNGYAFQQLMAGRWEGNYSSQSEADLALCDILAFYTKDPATIDRIFRRSGLYRDKWDEARPDGTYGTITIMKAINDVTETYMPKQPKKQKQLPDPLEMDLGYDKLYGPPVDGPIERKESCDPRTDLGRSKVFSERYKNKLLWCESVKAWYIWNGKYWQEDEVRQVMQLAKESVEDMIRYAAKAISESRNEDDFKRANQTYKEVLKAKSERSLKAMVELAKSDLPARINQFDQDPFLLNCQNGVVDLRTGELKPHNPDLFMTKIAHASYFPGKKFSLFGDFLNLITCGDTELAEYFQMVCGMAAIGKVFTEGLVIFWGTGSNGKSTFLNTISRVFGDYACSINPEVLMSQRDGKQPLGITKLDGKRFVTAMELEEGRRLSSSMLKQLSSTDMITGRELYQKERSFVPTHTLIMATNYLPKISSTDKGTWRRIAVAPFNASIEEKNQVKDYADVLIKNDGDAILSWIVEGAMKYIRNNYHIKSPKVVEKATEKYRESEDWLGNFIAECCECGDYEESGGNLYDAYVSWCERNNESYKRRPRDFAAELEKNGFEKRRVKRGSVWFGLRLIDNANTGSFSKYKMAKIKQISVLDDDELDDYTRKNM